MSGTEKARSGGFTLVELLVVVAILAIAFGAVVPRYVKNKQRAEERACQANVYALRVAISQYRSENGSYPPSLSALVSDGYLSKLPKCPAGGDYRYNPSDGTVTCPNGHAPPD